MRSTKSHPLALRIRTVEQTAKTKKKLSPKRSTARKQRAKLLNRIFESTGTASNDLQPQQQSREGRAGGGGAGGAQAVTTISNEWHNKWQRQQHNFLMQSGDNSSRMQIHRFMDTARALPSPFLPYPPAESQLTCLSLSPSLDTFGSTSTRPSLWPW